jgi:fumarate hydratase class I
MVFLHLSKVLRPQSKHIRKVIPTAASKAYLSDFTYSPLFQHDASNLEEDEITEYKQILPASAVSTSTMNGVEYLSVPGDALRTLSSTAFGDVAHLLRPKHLKQVRSILDDDEASPNDRFVALELLKNANIAAGRVLPGCQDTGTGG